MKKKNIKKLHLGKIRISVLNAPKEERLTETVRTKSACTACNISNCIC